MTQLTKCLAIKTLAICAALALLQSCGGGSQNSSPGFSVYSVGEFEDNLVIADGKYTTNYGVDPTDPDFYVKRFGNTLVHQEDGGERCVIFGDEFAISRSESSISRCGGWTFRRLPDENRYHIYQGYCPESSQSCPREFHNKPMLEYGLDGDGGLIFVRFDPQAPDSGRYVLRMGVPFRLN